MEERLKQTSKKWTRVGLVVGIFGGLLAGGLAINAVLSGRSTDASTRWFSQQEKILNLRSTNPFLQIMGMFVGGIAGTIVGGFAGSFLDSFADRWRRER